MLFNSLAAGSIASFFFFHTHEKVVVTLSEVGIGECFEGFLQNVSLQERK
jgi:hypothetical protein